MPSECKDIGDNPETYKEKIIQKYMNLTIPVIKALHTELMQDDQYNSVDVIDVIDVCLSFAASVFLSSAMMPLYRKDMPLSIQYKFIKETLNVITERSTRSFKEFQEFLLKETNTDLH